MLRKVHLVAKNKFDMKTLVLICSILMASCSNAQIPVFKYSGNEFSPELNKFITHHGNNVSLYVANVLAKDHREFHNSLCNTGVVFVRFKISPNGVSDIVCTKSSSDIILSALKDAIRATEKYWVTERGAKEQLFVLPFIYDYRKNGCGATQVKDSFNKGLFEFEDGSDPYNISYILLPPVTPSSGVEESDLEVK